MGRAVHQLCDNLICVTFQKADLDFRLNPQLGVTSVPLAATCSELTDRSYRAVRRGSASIRITQTAGVGQAEAVRTAAKSSSRPIFAPCRQKPACVPSIDRTRDSAVHTQGSNRSLPKKAGARENRAAIRSTSSLTRADQLPGCGGDIIPTRESPQRTTLDPGVQRDACMGLWLLMAANSPSMIFTNSACD